MTIVHHASHTFNQLQRRHISTAAKAVNTTTSLLFLSSPTTTITTAMQPFLRLSIRLPQRTHPAIRPLTTTSPLSTTPLNWKGRDPSEHVVNRTDETDVQSQPSHAGMREKDRHSKGSPEAGKEDSHSSGITEKDENKSNERAKGEISDKAPGPVIGMNDERGGKGH